MNEMTKVAFTYMISGVLDTLVICLGIGVGIAYGFSFWAIAPIVVGVLGYAVDVCVRLHNSQYDDFVGTLQYEIADDWYDENGEPNMMPNK